MCYTLLLNSHTSRQPIQCAHGEPFCTCLKRRATATTLQPYPGKRLSVYALTCVWIAAHIPPWPGSSHWAWQVEHAPTGIFIAPHKLCCLRFLPVSSRASPWPGSLCRILRLYLKPAGGQHPFCSLNAAVQSHLLCKDDALALSSCGANRVHIAYLPAMVRAMVNHMIQYRSVNPLVHFPSRVFVHKTLG